MLRLLYRSARKVLQTRELELLDGTRTRWLKADVARYLKEVSAMADEMRPVARLSALPNTGSRLMVELAVLTIAAYRVLLRRSANPRLAREVVADIGWDVFALGLSLSSLPFRLVSRDPGVRLRGTVKLLLRFPFNGPGAPGYAVRAWREGEDFFTHFTHCPPQTFVRSLVAERGDKGELEAFYESWCRYDFPGADIIAGDDKRGHYVRAQTLSRGDSVCDMCWQRTPVGKDGNNQQNA